MSYVLYSESEGVFLGIALGLGFWSKGDHVNQTSAVVVQSPAEGDAMMAEWLTGCPTDVRYVEVVADDDGYASMAACVAAGLPAWMTPQEFEEILRNCR